MQQHAVMTVNCHGNGRNTCKSEREPEYRMYMFWLSFCAVCFLLSGDDNAVHGDIGHDSRAVAAQLG